MNQLWSLLAVLLAMLLLGGLVLIAIETAGDDTTRLAMVLGFFAIMANGLSGIMGYLVGKKEEDAVQPRRGPSKKSNSK